MRLMYVARVSFTLEISALDSCCRRRDDVMNGTSASGGHGGLRQRCEFFHDASFALLTARRICAVPTGGRSQCKGCSSMMSRMPVDGGKSSGIMATNLRPQRISDDISGYRTISQDIGRYRRRIGFIFQESLNVREYQLFGRAPLSFECRL